MDGEQILPVNPFPLADGKYLMFYIKRERKKNAEMVPVFDDIDTTIVAAKCEIVNGM